MVGHSSDHVGDAVAPRAERHPGLGTTTPLLHSEPPKFLEAFLKAIPLRRFAKPSEIADAILFMASSRADYVTGQVLSVNGGITMVG